MEPRAFKSWYPEEDGQLINEYKYGKYTLQQIAAIHKRPLEQITRRVKLLQHAFAKKFTSHQTCLTKAGVTVSRPLPKPVPLTQVVTAAKTVTVLEPLLETDDTEETENDVPTVVEPITAVPYLLKISDYTCAGDAWTSEESDKLLALYKDHELGLMAISALHKRTPASIICKLRKMNIEPIMSNVRGYDTYKSSELYKEVMGVRKQKK